MGGVNGVFGSVITKTNILTFLPGVEDDGEAWYPEGANHRLEYQAGDQEAPDLRQSTCVYIGNMVT